MGMLGRFTGQSDQTALFSDFRRALTREILLTERLRVKALIATVLVLMACLLVGYSVVPANIERVGQGHFAIRSLLATTIPFIIFELWVLRQLNQRLTLDLDV